MCPWTSGFVRLQLLLLGPLLSRAILHDLPDEASAIDVIKNDKDIFAKCDAEEAGRLIKQGWWDAARDLVTLSHKGADADAKVALHSAVRKEAGLIKQRGEELMLELAVKDEKKVGTVRCSTQWAQNSSVIFLSVKYSHRWSSPGALEVHDQTHALSECCFNFSATGTHSQLNKRYHLDMEFYDSVDPDHWSWKPASAGRMTVEIRKKTPKKWPRLLLSQAKVGNLALWDSMFNKWGDEVDKFEKDKAAKTRKEKLSKDEVDTEAEEAAEEAEFDRAESKCPERKESPFFGSSRVSMLCEYFWPPKMKGKRGKDALWLVLFFSPSALDCKERGEECTKVRDWWLGGEKTVSRQMSSAKVAVVNCDIHKAFCQKQEVGHMPFVRKYKGGKRKAYYGGREVDALMQFAMS